MNSKLRLLVFDSGIGGLSALGPLLRQGLNLEVRYFGDLANLPYGTKSPQKIKELTRNGLLRLLQDEIPKTPHQLTNPFTSQQLPRPDLVLLACNTASAVAASDADEVCHKFSVPVMNVLDPTCELAIQVAAEHHSRVQASSSARIVVLATSATIKAQAYSLRLKALGFTGTVTEVACPLFVPFVEAGIFDGPGLDWTIEYHCGAHIQSGDIVILGCTHYPFLLPALQNRFPDCRFLEAGQALLRMEPFLSASKSRQSSAPAHQHIHLEFSDESSNTQGAEQLIHRLVDQSIRATVDPLKSAQLTITPSKR